jgi:hypothetical protein
MSRLLLLAWSGATAAAVSRLLDAQRLPNLHRLVERGVIADLRPDCRGAEAMTWTTVATGVRADVHGVLADLRPREGGSGVCWAGSGDWRRPALWQWLDAAGATTAVVNWPATHPAPRTQRGICVSPPFLHAPVGDPCAWLLPPDAVWPAPLREPLATLRLHPSDLTAAEAAALVPNAAAIDQGTDPRLIKILVSFASNAGAHAVGTQLVETAPAMELLAVHFDLLLAANEAADRSPAGAAYADTPDRVLCFYDQMLGRYLELLGDGVSVLVVSPGWRSAPGVLVAAGEAVHADRRAMPCTTLDVLPIALRLMGWQAPADAQGRAPETMFRRGTPLRPLPPCPVADETGEPSPVDHLIQAGYQPAAPPMLVNIAIRQRAADLAQLARLRLGAGDAAGAARLAEQAEQLYAARPFTELAARAAFIAGDFTAAAAAADRLLAAEPQSPAGHVLKMFLAHLHARASASALPHATPEQSYYAGVLALLRGESASAARLLGDAAVAMPANSHVLHALGLAYRQAGDLPQAIETLARAANLSAQPAAVLVHFAQALLSAGDEVRAEGALRQALSADPGCAAASSLLEGLLRRRQFRAVLSAAPTAGV